MRARQVAVDGCLSTGGFRRSSYANATMGDSGLQDRELRGSPGVGTRSIRSVPGSACGVPDLLCRAAPPQNDAIGFDRGDGVTCRPVQQDSDKRTETINAAVLSHHKPDAPIFRGDLQIIRDANAVGRVT
jgi:hypothetical protein